jgi:hypothetical protein
MSLSYRQEHQLRRIEAGLCRSEPDLGAMSGVFGRLCTGEVMPACEQLPSGQVRFQPAAWTVAVLTAVAAAAGALLAAAVALVTARRRGRTDPSTSKLERPRHGGEANNQQDPPMPSSATLGPRPPVEPGPPSGGGAGRR